ncbi:MAG: FxsA family protein [Gallionellaceae bacterium]
MRNFGLIFLLLIFGLPAVEIYTMFIVADYIHWWLLLWLILSALAGWLLIKEESLALFGRLAVAVQNGQSPFVALWDSGRTMLAAILLIFPGVLTDAVALILLLLPNKAEQVNARNYADGDVIEGEGHVVDVEVERIAPQSEHRDP